MGPVCCLGACSSGLAPEFFCPLFHASGVPVQYKTSMGAQTSGYSVPGWQIVNYVSAFPCRANWPPPLLQSFSVAWERPARRRESLLWSSKAFIIFGFILTNSSKVAISRKNDSSVFLPISRSCLIQGLTELSPQFLNWDYPPLSIQAEPSQCLNTEGSLLQQNLPGPPAEGVPAQSAQC